MAWLDEGREVGPYRVERRLGGGGFASVYLATHRVLHSTCALKVLAPELVALDEVRDRFLGEGRILAQLRHPNLVRVTDLVSEPGVAALVMEYVEGPTLDAHLERHPGGCTLDRAREILTPVLDAIGHAHARGVIHRDLKPANLLLSSDHHDHLRPVVIDFGIAHLQQDAHVTGGRRSPTQTGMRIGTPSYMSPEQVRGGKVDARADVFALGVILYELLTGQRAFDAEADFDTMRLVVDGQWTPARALRPELPEVVDRVLATALALNPEQRFASCAAFAEALAPLWSSAHPLGASAAPAVAPAALAAPAPPEPRPVPPAGEPPSLAPPGPTSAPEARSARLPRVRTVPEDLARADVPEIPAPPVPHKAPRKQEREGEGPPSWVRFVLGAAGAGAGLFFGAPYGTSQAAVASFAGMLIGWYILEIAVVGCLVVGALGALAVIVFIAWLLFYDAQLGWFGS